MNAPHTLFPQVPPSSTGPAMGQSHIHESARAQVAGAAHYIDDLPEVKGTLYAAPILSTVAHGRLNGVDARAALALSGVRGVVLAADVPGDKLLAAFAQSGDQDPSECPPTVGLQRVDPQKVYGPQPGGIKKTFL